MKKLILIAGLIFGTSTLQACDFGDKLYILNWQEYINEDLVDEFEEQFGVKVVAKNLISNELMYSELKQGNSYDVIFPSDYMVEKLASEDLIIELDRDLITNYTSTNMYTTGLDTLVSQSGYDEYFIPYFWGSLGIMYNKTKAGVEDTVKAQGWDVFFNEETLTNNRVMMYSSSRDSFAAAAMYMQTTSTSDRDTTISINNYTTAQLNKCADLLKNASYHGWGDDDIKTAIGNANADIALVYSGDFFDQLWADEFKKTNDYDIYIPEVNNVFFDAMCIPTNARNTDLAHEFINFMMEHENAVDNALDIGYCPAIQTVFNDVMSDSEMDCVTDYRAWNPYNITYGTVYKDLGTTYSEMEKLYQALRVG